MPMFLDRSCRESPSSRFESADVISDLDFLDIHLVLMPPAERYR